jgi:hypothetical protein
MSDTSLFIIPPWFNIDDHLDFYDEYKAYLIEMKANVEPWDLNGFIQQWKTLQKPGRKISTMDLDDPYPQNKSPEYHYYYIGNKLKELGFYITTVEDNPSYYAIQNIWGENLEQFILGQIDKIKEYADKAK